MSSSIHTLASFPVARISGFAGAGKSSLRVVAFTTYCCAVIRVSLALVYV